MLVVMDGKYDYGHFFGPNGNLPDDVWSMRRFAVVERISKKPDHPYSSVVMFWDSENWHPWMAPRSTASTSCGRRSSTRGAGARITRNGPRSIMAWNRPRSRASRPPTTSISAPQFLPISEPAIRPRTSNRWARSSTSANSNSSIAESRRVRACDERALRTGDGRNHVRRSTVHRRQIFERQEITSRCAIL